MKLEDLIYKKINNYPGLFLCKDDFASSRLATLNHLFLVSGNGYSWSNEGYMVNHVASPKYNTHFMILPGGASPGWYSENAPPYGKETYSHKLIHPLVSGVARLPYPGCAAGDRANAFWVPVNVQPDWLAGVLETLEWALAYCLDNPSPFPGYDYESMAGIFARQIEAIISGSRFDYVSRRVVVLS